jgi:hypothetical protein
VDILRKVRDIESTIARQFDSAAKKLARPGAREPLEIVHAIVDAVDRDIQPGSRGRRVFPYNRIRVSVAAPTREARRRLETVLSGDELQRRIADKLCRAGCDAASVAVAVTYTTQPHKNWRDADFHVAFANVEAPKVDTPAAPADQPRLDITIVRGVAEKRTYSLAGDRVDIGRCAEVKDTHSRLIRRNDVAFLETAAEHNQTVSRQHAHIRYQSASREFRLFDDGSAHGTQIVRGGSTVTVHRGSRGVRLQSGDEIVVGEARMRIKVRGE